MTGQLTHNNSSRANFLNFDIVIGNEKPQGYPFYVDSPAGKCSGHWPAEKLNRVQSILVRLKNLSAQDADLKNLGRLLQFPSPVAELWQQSRSLAGRQEKPCGLRIRFTVEPPELAVLPWEYLLRPGSEDEFLALDPHTPIIRYCANDYQPRPLPSPLRILVIAPSPGPAEEGWAQLDSHSEVVYLLLALDNWSFRL